MTLIREIVLRFLLVEKKENTHTHKNNRRNYNNDTIRHKIILPAASSFLTPHYVISVLITVFLDKLRSGG